MIVLNPNKNTDQVFAITNKKKLLDSAQAFIRKVQAGSYKDKPLGVLVPLTNITFFLGAGFSKSWDISYPTGSELFTFEADQYSDDLFEFIDNIGLGGFGKKFDFSTFKDMAYQLSMQKKYPALRSRYMNLYNINLIENEINYVITKRFQELATINYVKKFNEKLALPTTPSRSQRNIAEFFRWMNDQLIGDTGMPEGVRPHFITTNYDFLVESILDEILAPDDTHLLYAYRGFTPLKTNGVKTPRAVFKHWLVQSLIKINGGFEIYKDANGFSVNYTTKSDEQLKKNAPVLIVPNREQDYTGIYFQTIFTKAIRVLQESKILVIVGYSLPEEDALLRLLIRQFAEENVDGSEKTIFYITPMTEQEQLDKLQSVFPYHSVQRQRYSLFIYSGYFNDWVDSIVKQL